MRATAATGSEPSITRRGPSASMAVLLNAHLVPYEGRGRHAVNWERDVDQAEGHKDEVAIDLNAGVVELWDTKYGDGLLPTQARMRHEHTNAADVERSPKRIL